MTDEMKKDGVEIPIEDGTEEVIDEAVDAAEETVETAEEFADALQKATTCKQNTFA